MAVSSGSVTVGAAAVALNSESGATSGTRLYVSNTSANDATLGDASVTGATGFVLEAGASLALELSHGEVVYAIRTDSDDATLQVMRTGV